MASNRLIKKLRAFLANQTGNFAGLMAVASLPLMGSIGVAVDFSRMYRAQSEMQQAVDSAVLAAARRFADTSSKNSLEEYAEDYFDANFNSDMGDNEVAFSLTSKASPLTNSQGESIGYEITATASGNYPLTLGNVMGMAKKRIAASASATVHPNTIEAAFVFDASGSMTDNDHLQKSTKAAKDLLHDMKQFVLAMQNATGTSTQYIRYALIPFAHSVNIGTSHAADPDIMDTMGLGAHHHDNIDWGQGYPLSSSMSTGYKDGSDWLTRFTLLDEIGDDWMGCVEARPYPYFLDDTSPNSMNADTLYTPMVALDEPDNYGGSEVDYTNNYLEDDVISKFNSIALTGSNHGNENKQADRIEWTSKYNEHATVKNYDKNGMGPNRPCLDYAVFPLNGDFGLTNAEISHINNTFAASKTIGSGDDDGATNIQQGIAWGWRVVSSTAPFEEGRPESDTSNKKVLIVITDGINSYGDTTTKMESEYGAFGFHADGRLDAGLTAPALMTSREKLDEHTLTTCDNAKNAGVLIFVIGYGVSDGSDEESFLSECSGGTEAYEYYFNVADETALDAAFNRIRDQLIDIHLSS